MSRFAKYAWFTLGYNVLVILWGVFLRASKSGDGCGEHWLTCNGEIIPSAPQFKTVIEFSHRMTTAVDGIVMLILVGLAVWVRHKKHNTHSKQILWLAIGSLFFVITEAAVGAGLVLTGNTAETVTDVRPFWAIGHLVNTFILLAFLTMTAWFASGERRLRLAVGSKTAVLLALGVIGFIFVGMSGSLAALSNMLFPSASVTEGIARDFAETSSVILRLRISHPILSVMTSVYVIFLAGWLKARSGNIANVTRWSSAVSILVILQVVFGAVTLLTLGPIIMQLGHLLLADLTWIAFIMMIANYLSVRDQSFA